MVYFRRFLNLLQNFNILITNMNLVVFLWLCLAILSPIAKTQAAEPPLRNIQNSQNTPQNEFNHRPDITMDKQIDEKYLQQIEENENQQQLGQINQWVAHELNDSKELRNFSATQSFIIKLQNEQSYEYRWDLSIPNSRQRDYHLQLNVYTYQDGTDIAFSHNPDQASFVQAQVRRDLHGYYTTLGKVYVRRTFSLNFQKDAQILKFTNYNSQSILLEINMQVEMKHVQHIKESIAVDKQFQLPAQKLDSIFQQARQTEKARSQTYKWQWGFLQREERYESEMLKLTGVQLFAVIVTAIIQMYCIKTLLQSKQVV